MIDRVVSVSDDADRLEATSTVPEASPVFEGHFPGMPLLPGVLLIETMAQASGFLVLARTKAVRMPLLAGVKSAKMRAVVEPGQALEIEATLEHDGSGFAMTSARIQSGGKPVCEASLTLKTLEFPTAEFGTMIVDRARFLGLPDRFLP